MIDTHIHLDQYDDTKLPYKIEKWKQHGIRGVIAVSTSLASSYKTLELKERFPQFVHAAVGFHPELPLPKEADINEWERLIKSERKQICAIGEIGLPHYSLINQKLSDIHMHHLEHYIHIASTYDLPVALHAVHEKAAIAYELLTTYGIQKAHFHWLKAPESIVKKIVAARYFISVTPEVCYRKRDQQLIKHVPLSQLLIETDGPWSFSGPFQQKQTTPLLLKDVLHSVAQVKGHCKRMVKAQLAANSRRCYNV